MNEINAAIGKEKEKRHACKEIDPIISSGWHTIIKFWISLDFTPEPGHSKHWQAEMLATSWSRERESTKLTCKTRNSLYSTIYFKTYLVLEEFGMLHSVMIKYKVIRESCCCKIKEPATQSDQNWQRENDAPVIVTSPFSSCWGKESVVARESRCRQDLWVEIIENVLVCTIEEDVHCCWLLGDGLEEKEKQRTWQDGSTIWKKSVLPFIVSPRDFNLAGCARSRSDIALFPGH